MIPPTVKSRRRYIAFRLLAKPVFTPNQVVQAIRQAVLSFIGEQGYAVSEFDVVDYDASRLVGVVRTTPGHVDDVITALSLVTSVQGKSAGIVVLGVSGTIKRAKEKYLSDEKTYLKEMKLNN